MGNFKLRPIIDYNNIEEAAKSVMPKAQAPNAAPSALLHSRIRQGFSVIPQKFAALNGPTGRALPQNYPRVQCFPLSGLLFQGFNQVRQTGALLAQARS